MKKKKATTYIFLICFLFIHGATAVAAQTTTAVQIRLRKLNGTPIPQETVRIVALPDYTEQTAVTDLNGHAAFNLARGIYEVHLSASLDRVSALAVGEGGLEGFGITVGDVPITYSFVFNTDNRFYFDATPELAMGSPIIPQLEDLHFENRTKQPTATPLTVVTVIEPTIIHMVPVDTETAENKKPNLTLPIVTVLMGIFGTSSLWAWRQRKNEKIAQTKQVETLPKGDRK